MPVSTWIAFLIASIILCVSPGPGALASIASGMRHGWSRGMWNVFGMQTATLFNVVIIAFGLGALLVASTTAFEILKWCGALYLVWLGVAKWREIPVSFDKLAAAKSDRSDRSRHGIFRQGFFVSLTNPKGLVFLLAVLPQFIDAALPQAMQYAILAATLVAVDLVVMGCYTGLAAKMLRLLGDPAHIRLTNRFIGSLFVCAGAALAAFRR